MIANQFIAPDMPIEMLVVDDDPHVLALLQDALFIEPKFVVTALASSIEAVETARRKHFDLLFTDFKMPELDGLTLSCAVKEIQPDICTVIITGYASMDNILEAMKMGIFDFITKPFTMDEFYFTLEKCTRKIALERENRMLREKIAALLREVAILRGQNPALSAP